MLKFIKYIFVPLLAIALAAPVVQAGTSRGAVESKKNNKNKAKSSKHKVKNGALRQTGKVTSRARPAKKMVTTSHRRKMVSQRVSVMRVGHVVPAKPTLGDLAGLNQTRDPLALKSNVAFVMDQTTSQILLEKNARVALPIASITKLMTSLVVLDANQNMNEILEVTNNDVDHEKNSSSRLRVGTRLSRADMLHIALMSSENRAASALGHNFPGGINAFVRLMNDKARALGMTDTHYVDSTGLSSQNVASARDLAKLVNFAYQNYPLVRQYSTDTSYVVASGGRSLQYSTSNGLVKNPDWDIGLQKTGYISEAGRCLVMQTKIDGRPVVMVLLDSKGKQSRIADATRVRRWLLDTRQEKTPVAAGIIARQS